MVLPELAIRRFARRFAAGALSLATLLLAPAVAHAQAQELPTLPELGESIIEVSRPLLLGSVKLQVTVFRPPGEGPFPLLVFNHGKAPGDSRFQPRYRPLVLVREFLARGYVVVVPMRQGFASSGGQYISGGCNVESNGVAQAQDVKAVLDYLVQQPWVDKAHIVVGGQSHGGLTTLALGTMNYPGVRALINFAGGLRDERCPAWERGLVETGAGYGSKTTVPSVWFYGDNDSYFSPEVFRPMFQKYTAAGAPAKLVAFGPWPHGDAHSMVGQRAGLAVWVPEVEALLRQVNMPHAVHRDLTLVLHDGTAPAPSKFAAIDDVAKVPVRSEAAREGYQRFLAAESPKAFAIAPTGSWAFMYGRPDVMRQALSRCNGFAKADICKLYAVDDQVVWAADSSTAK